MSFGLRPSIPFSIIVYVFSTTIDGSSSVCVVTEEEAVVSFVPIGELAVTIAVLTIAPESEPVASIKYEALNFVTLLPIIRYDGHTATAILTLLVNYYKELSYALITSRKDVPKPIFEVQAIAPPFFSASCLTI